VRREQGGHLCSYYQALDECGNFLKDFEARLTFEAGATCGKCPIWASFKKSICVQYKYFDHG